MNQIYSSNLTCSLSIILQVKVGTVKVIKSSFFRISDCIHLCQILENNPSIRVKNTLLRDHHKQLFTHISIMLVFTKKYYKSCKSVSGNWNFITQIEKKETHIKTKKENSDWRSGSKKNVKLPISLTMESKEMDKKFKLIRILKPSSTEVLFMKVIKKMYFKRPT